MAHGERTLFGPTPGLERLIGYMLMQMHSR